MISYEAIQKKTIDYLIFDENSDESFCDDGNESETSNGGRYVSQGLLLKAFYSNGIGHTNSSFSRKSSPTDG